MAEAELNEYISVNSNYHITILTGPYCGYLLGSLVDLVQSIFTKAQGFLDFRLKFWDIERVKKRHINITMITINVLYNIYTMYITMYRDRTWARDTFMTQKEIYLSNYCET